MRLLHTTAAQPTFSKLTEEQFELCLHELLVTPELFESGRDGASVVAYYTIKAWNIAGVKVETNSGLGVYYGAKPIIVPEFSFETMDIFECLQDTLKRVGLCQLNPKHIKSG